MKPGRIQKTVGFLIKAYQKNEQNILSDFIILIFNKLLQY